MFKRVITLLFCLLLVFVATFGFVVGVVSVPTIFSYASEQEESTSVPPQYTQVSSNNELGEGFLAYCKSRDSDITSSTIGASVTAAYNSLAKFCNYAGFNIADLQSHLWYLNQPGKPTRWFFDSTGINIYNRAFAYLIQENGLEVGDNADVEIYDGKYYDNSLFFIVNKLSDRFGAESTVYKSDVLQYGTYYGLSASDILSNFPSGSSYSGSFNNVNFRVFTDSPDTYYGYMYGKINVNGNVTSGTKIINGYNSNANTPHWNGFFCLVYCVNDGNTYIGNYSYYVSDNSFQKFVVNNTPVNVNESQNVTVNFTTNNTVINNNNYQGDTIINNNGDVIINPDDPDPGDPDDPDSGDPTIPYNPYPDNPNYDPNDTNSPPGTVTPPINPSDPNGGDNVNIDFPDFDLDLPEINWSLGDLSQKFPFSIPFDMVSLVRVLDAPAEAPRFQGTVNFGFTTWDYDINLDQFSTVAAVCRILEALLFVFGLILITRNLIKG